MRGDVAAALAPARHADDVADDIRAEAARQLERLRVARGLEARAPHTLGHVFPPTPGVPLSEHEPAPLVPMPLDEWVAASDPDRTSS